MPESVPCAGGVTIAYDKTWAGTSTSVALSVIGFGVSSGVDTDWGAAVGESLTGVIVIWTVPTDGNNPSNAT